MSEEVMTPQVFAQTREELNLETEASLVEDVENLTYDNLVDYARNGPTKPAWDLASLKARHHRIARMMALGYTDQLICEALDIASNTLTKLKAAPAFQELLSNYADEVYSADAETKKVISLVGDEALDVLHERLREREVTTSEARKIAQLALDRTGHSPVQRKESRRLLGVDAESMRELKRQYDESDRLHRREARYRESEVGRVMREPTVSSSEDIEATFEVGGGDQVREESGS